MKIFRFTGGGAGGASNFTDLGDAFASYASKALQLLRIKADETGIESVAGGLVPAGGTAGQVLKKKTGTNYDTEWGTPAAGAGIHTLIGMHTFTGAESEYEFTGLSGYDKYFVSMCLSGTDTSVDSIIDIYVNGDEVDTNYYSKNSLNPTLDTTPFFFIAHGGGGSGEGTVCRLPSGIFCWHTMGNAPIGDGSVWDVRTQGHKIATVPSITSIKFKCVSPGSLPAAGSWIKLIGEAAA